MNLNFYVIFPAVCISVVTFTIVLIIILLSSYIVDSIKGGTKSIGWILLCTIADVIIIVASIWAMKGLFFDFLFFG